MSQTWVTWHPYVNPQQQFLRSPQPFPEASKLRLNTFSRLYNKPIKFRFEIFDQEFKPVTNFDCFDVEHGYTPEINVHALNVTDGFNQAGSFSISFYDHDGVIDKPNMNGNWVQIEIGRDQSKMEKIMFGKVTQSPINRGRMTEKYHSISGYSLELILKETSVDIIKSAKIMDIATGVVNQNDSELFACNIINKLLTTTDYLIAKDGGTIQDRCRLKVDGINKRVNDFVGSVNAQRSTALDVANRVSEIAIAFLKIDGNRNVIFDYPNNRHSGKVLKQFDVNDKMFDFEDNTSYFHGDWNYTPVFELESGSANVLYSDEGFLKENVSNSSNVGSYFSLWNRDLAQQCIASPDFKDIYLLLSRAGAGSPNLTHLHGHIMLDRNNLPTGTKLTNFDIPLSAIPQSDSPEPIAVSDFLYNSSLLKEESLVWIVLYERGNSEANTIRWYHDNDYLTTGRFKSAVRPLPNGTYPNGTHESNLNWFLLSEQTPAMPNFAFSLVRSNKVRVIAEDTISIAQHGRVEAPFNVQWSDNLITTSKALHAALYFSSKDRVEFFNKEVFVPTNYYFPVGDIITIVDEHSGLTKRKSQTGQIFERSIDFNTETTVTGTHYMSIMMKSYYNPLIDAVNNYNPADPCEV